MVAFADSFGLSPVQIDEVFATMRLHGIGAAVLVVLLLIVRRLPRLGALWPRIGMLGLIILMAASADRIVAVLVPPGGSTDPILCMHPTRGFAHRTDAIGFVGGRYIKTNSLGFRGQPIALPKPADEWRVLFLGDSVAFGFLLDDDETIPAVTQSLLAAQRIHGKVVCCHNAAIAGYATWQELDLLRNEGRQASPDVVVLTFCLNDIVDLAAVGHGVVRGLPGDLSISAGEHWSGFARAVHLYAAQRRNLRSSSSEFWAGENVGGSGDSEAIKAAAYATPMSAAYEQAWQSIYADLRSMHEVCREINATFIILYAPPVFEVSREALLQVHRNRLREWAGEQGIVFIDPTEALRDAAGPNAERTREVWMDAIHPDSLGISIMANAVAVELSKKAAN